MCLDDMKVTTTGAKKNLGVILDQNLPFGEHVTKVPDMARNMIMAINRIIAKGNPSQSRRRLLITTLDSFLLYGADGYQSVQFWLWSK